MHRFYLIKTRRILISYLIYILICTLFLSLNNVSSLYTLYFSLMLIESNYTSIFLYLYLPFLLYFYYLLNCRNKQFTMLYTIRFKTIEMYLVDKFKTVLSVSVMLTMGFIISSFLLWIRYQQNIIVDTSYDMVKTSIFKIILILMYTILLILTVECLHLIIKDLYLCITIFIFFIYFLYLIYSLGIYDKLLELIFGESVFRTYNFLLFDIFNSQFINNGILDDFIILCIYLSLFIFLFFKLSIKQFYIVLEVINENY